MTEETSTPRPALVRRPASVQAVPKQTRGRMVVVNFRVPASTKEQATEICQRLDVNLTEVLRDYLVEWVAEHRDDQE